MTDTSGVLGSNIPLPPVPPDLQVVSVQRFEATSPTSGENLELVESPDETFATTKEEEWVTKKKTEVTTTRQIETRVKRQVVLEDGRVVEDSGPIVTTNTTEDTEKQEHEQTERRTLGDDGGAKSDVNGKELLGDDSPPGKGWVAVAETPLVEGGAAVVKEVKERRVLSREETQETRETEDVQHLGDITDEQFLAAVNTGKEDIRIPLRDNSQAIVSTGPRLVHQSTRTRKIVDTEDTNEKSALQPDGRIISETKRVTEHEETKDREFSDDDAADINVVNESSSKHIKVKDQEFVDYVADGVPLGREMRFTAETTEGERHGDPGMDDPYDWDSLSTRIKKSRRQAAARNQLLKQRGLGAAPDSFDRTDALTKQPLDFDQEEETRKKETSKWLEHHFGSESHSSNNSIGDEELVGPKTSYFNVTIKSKPRVVKPEPTSPIKSEPISPKSYVATVNSSSKVYTPSPEPKPLNGRYFQGVSEWSERRYEENRNRSPQITFDDKDVSRKVMHYGSIDELEKSSPRFTNGDRPIKNGHTEKVSPYYKNKYSEDIPDRESPFQPIDESARNYRSVKQSHTEHEEVKRFGKHLEEDEYAVPTPPQRKRGTDRKQRTSDDSRYDSGYRSQSRNEMSYRSRDSKDESPIEEPPPDYSPPPVVTPSPSPSPPPPVKDKKLYQRTRFAADIPPTVKQPVRQNAGNIIGQSIRKLVGKIRSASAERKAKQKAKRMSSRSPSPHHSRNSPTYQQFNVIDNNIPPPVCDSNNRRHYEVGGSNEKQVSSTLYRSRSSDQNMTDSKRQRGRTSSPVQRYYLGEDPFVGSIYGRENKYDGVKPFRSSKKHSSKYNGYQKHSYPEEDYSRNHSSTLGRFSKSTSRLASNGDTIDYSRTAQTLPRNIHHSETAYKSSKHLSHSPPTRLSKNNHSNSTINVSFINTVSPPSSTISVNRPIANGGPAKPARTYKSALSRSKSFNVNVGDIEPTNLLKTRNVHNNVYKSNPHLHRLEENPTQLKSPGIVSSISRSQRDLNDAIIEEDHKENSYTHRFQKNGNYDDGLSNKRIFLKGLADRAPELFKTLHGNENEENSYNRGYSSKYSKINTGNDSYQTLPNLNNKYKSSKNENGYDKYGMRMKYDSQYNSPVAKIESNYNTPVVHSVVRRGSNSSDYSETYHITSKSADPKRPSVTDTVKSFSKKTIPSKDGRSLETIESTETKTITKSRFLGDPVSNYKYIENGRRHGSSPNGGVVIEVRNENYRK